MIAIAIRFLALGMLMVSMPSRAAEVADALQAAERMVNEYMLRTQVIISCHPIQTDADKAYIDSGETIGNTVFEQIWAYLDAIDPARHADNGDKADRTLEQIIVGAEQQAEHLVQESGCAALEDKLKAAK